MSSAKKQQDLVDAILGTKKKAHPSEPGDLHWRARSFGELSLEERVEKLEAGYRRPVESAQQLTNVADSSARETALRMILDQKGFSVHDWAKKAGVDFHTASNYRKGKTKPYPSTRKKLADALGIKVEDLPG
jgi:ribosome-binding protein aMBF1 (putative translation factor)